MWCHVLYEFIKKLESEKILQLVNISYINNLNKFVFTVNACCLKNIFIHNLDTLFCQSKYIEKERNCSI